MTRPVYLRMPEIIKKLSIGRTKIFQLVKDGVLPRPLKIGKISLWIESDIDRAIMLLKKRQEGGYEKEKNAKT